MAKLVQIPEETLAALLREAGHPESVETFLVGQGVPQAIVEDQRLSRRARAAYWSRFWLAFSAVVTWAGVLTGPDAEGLIAGVLLTGMTVVEFRVHRLFQAGDRRGATDGWWNQCLFAALFLVYGGYHAIFVRIPPTLDGLLDPGMTPTVLSLERVAYLAIGLIGGAGQFWLACFYRAARK